MQYDLTPLNRTSQRVGIFVRAIGTDDKDNPVDLILDYQQHVSGCNPYVWVIRGPYSSYMGHEFSDPDEALDQAKHAACAYNVKTFDLTTIKLCAFQFKTVQSVFNMGDIVTQD